MPRRPVPVLAVTALGIAGLAAAVAGCDTNDGRALAEPAPGATAPPLPETTTSGPVIMNPPVGSSDTATMTVTSPAVAAGAVLPTEYSCLGENRSLPLSWSNVPIEAVELAVSLVDISVESGRFIHWAVAGLDPTIVGLGAGADVVALEGAVVGRNDSTEFGWYGPCPPAGETHTYVLTLYALDERSGVQAGVSGADLLAAVESKLLSIASLELSSTGP